MKLARVFSRLALLSLAAAVLAGFTGVYGGFVRVTPPGPLYQAYHRNPPPAPQGSEVPGFIRAVLEVALFAVGGRLALRLRFSPVPAAERRPIVLDLSAAASPEVIVAQRLERRPI